MPKAPLKDLFLFLQFAYNDPQFLEGRQPYPVEEKKYLDGILWKRDFHKENGTKLIETYSYYSSEGILLKKLEEFLVENNVEFKPRDFTDIFNTVYASKSNKYFSEFIKLCCTFISITTRNFWRVVNLLNSNLFVHIEQTSLKLYNYLHDNN